MDLGVTFDTRLSFEPHIREKTRKANRMLHGRVETELTLNSIRGILGEPVHSYYVGKDERRLPGISVMNL